MTDIARKSNPGSRLRDHQTALTHLASERDLLVAKASAALAHLNASRGRRADVAALRSRLDDIQMHTRQLRDDSDVSRERIAARRAALTTRRQVLEEAYRLSVGTNNSPPRTPTPTPPGGPPKRKPPSPIGGHRESLTARISELEAQLQTLQESLARARQGLVQELVDVFAVVEVGGRPAAGVRAATRGAWSIGGLVLPVPGDMRRVPPSHANAALTYTLHFVGLLTFYLGVRLPFEVGWSGGKLGVGIPEIWATRGEDRGGWAKWTVRCPLHLPLSPSSANVTASPPTSGPSSPSGSPRPSSESPYPPASSNTPSTHSRRDSLSFSQTYSPAHVSTAASFSTALAMLSYNTAYLAQTQGVDVSLSSAASGQILATLWAVCCSAELGVRSHDTRPLLQPPASVLDFRQLLQAQAIASGAAASAGITVPSVATGRRGRERMHKAKIAVDVVAEEEDGWEVVDET